MICVLFSVWLFLLSIKAAGFIHSIMCITNTILLIAKQGPLCENAMTCVSVLLLIGVRVVVGGDC